jgi:hypothetical protein
VRALQSVALAIPSSSTTRVDAAIAGALTASATTQNTTINSFTVPSFSVPSFSFFVLHYSDGWQNAIGLRRASNGVPRVVEFADQPSQSSVGSVPSIKHAQIRRGELFFASSFSWRGVNLRRLIAVAWAADRRTRISHLG